MLELAHGRRIEGVLHMRSFEMSWGPGELRRVHRSDESSCGHARLRRIPSSGFASSRVLGASAYEMNVTDLEVPHVSREVLEPIFSHTFVRFPRRRDV